MVAPAANTVTISGPCTYIDTTQATLADKSGSIAVDHFRCEGITSNTMASHGSTGVVDRFLIEPGTDMPICSVLTDAPSRIGATRFELMGQCPMTQAPVTRNNRTGPSLFTIDRIAAAPALFSAAKTVAAEKAATPIVGQLKTILEHKRSYTFHPAARSIAWLAAKYTEIDIRDANNEKTMTLTATAYGWTVDIYPIGATKQTYEIPMESTELRKCAIALSNLIDAKLVNIAPITKEAARRL